MATPRPPRVSWVLLVAVVVALAVGAAASILVGAVTTSSSSSGPASLVYLPPWLLALASFGILAFVGISIILMRLNGGTSSGQSQFAVRVLMAILIAVVFLLAVHLLGSPGLGSGNSTAQNATGTPPPPPNGGSHYVNGSGGVVVWPGLPPWLPFVILAGVVLVVVIAVVPELRWYLEERRGGKTKVETPVDVAPVRAALARAATELQEGHDPRDVILALYTTLLTRLRPVVVGLDASTPEEIRATHLERLGVRPSPARTLTRLFEEARYSRHPMGRESSEAAQDAVREVLDDLDRRESSS
ncbi:MAG TPA: DUF4129 domain-containing protein [Thermoplasmata archaeon]|jgi:hypothetical protein|nr:DUF4129 domain-containing protein [Thermoplasmata archaeon]